MEVSCFLKFSISVSKFEEPESSINRGGGVGSGGGGEAPLRPTTATTGRLQPALHWVVFSLRGMTMRWSSFKGDRAFRLFRQPFIILLCVWLLYFLLRGMTMGWSSFKETTMIKIWLEDQGLKVNQVKSGNQGWSMGYPWIPLDTLTIGYIEWFPWIPLLSAI